jgi:hypothetical protein
MGDHPRRHRHPAVSRVLRSAPDPPQNRAGPNGAGMTYQVSTGRFVGRTQELARLSQLLAHVADGQPL